MDQIFGIPIVWAVVPSVVAVLIVVGDAVARGRIIAWDVAAVVLIVGGAFVGAALYILARDWVRYRATKRQQTHGRPM